MKVRASFCTEPFRCVLLITLAILFAYLIFVVGILGVSLTCTLGIFCLALPFFGVDRVFLLQRKCVLFEHQYVHVLQMGSLSIWDSL